MNTICNPVTSILPSLTTCCYIYAHRTSHARLPSVIIVVHVPDWHKLRTERGVEKEASDNLTHGTRHLPHLEHS